MLSLRYHKDIYPWTSNGERVKAVEDNEHLGLVVSGYNEEQQNVDANINKCKNTAL